MNLDRIKVGDKFTTEKKLLIKVGFEKYDGNKQKQLQLRELKRYLTYDKTGKMSRGKITNEIIITEIYDMPKPKIDNRSNNGGNNTNAISDYIEYHIESDLYKQQVLHYQRLHRNIFYLEKECSLPIHLLMKCLKVLSYHKKVRNLKLL